MKGYLMKYFWTYGITPNGKALMVAFDNAFSAEMCKDQLKIGGYQTVGYSRRACSEHVVRNQCFSSGAIEINVIPYEEKEKCRCGRKFSTNCSV